MGVTTGIGLENKDTLLFLGAGLAVGTRPHPALGCHPLAVGVGGPRDRAPALGPEPRLAGDERLAAAHHGLAIAGYAADNRAQVVPLLWLFTGPLLFPVSAAGLVWVLGSKAAAPWRAIGIAALVALALVFVSGGKGYYAIGTVPLFMAAGAIAPRPLAGPWPSPVSRRRASPRPPRSRAR